MRKPRLSTLPIAFALSAALIACDQSMTGVEPVKPQFDNETPGLGEPCDPETYNGPYQCLPGPNGRTFVQLG
jgi:hypothetical protein